MTKRSKAKEIAFVHMWNMGELEKNEKVYTQLLDELLSMSDDFIEELYEDLKNG